jgi:hypothetical protein
VDTAIMIEEQYRLPVIVPAKGRLTEYEARVAGLTSTALITLRNMERNSNSGGSIQTAGGTMKLTANDVQACLSLLTERGENLLHQLDIQLDHEGS